MKRTAKTVMIAVMILTCIIGTVIPAMAGGNELEQELIRLPAFKFWNHDKNGIGYGNCPVYTAPSKKAYRGADGKASCYTNAEMSEAGYYSGWLLVRYETNNGAYRVGYIPPEYVKGFKSKMGTRKFTHRISAKAERTIYVTDDPMNSGSYFAKLKAGTAFQVLAKYTYYGNWWYIQCRVNGKVARGFIDRSSSVFSVGGKIVDPNAIPDRSSIGTSCMGYVKIVNESSGQRVFVRKAANPNSNQVTVAYPGKKYPYYAKKTGSTGKDWYLIWVDADSAWGWVSSGYARKTN